MVGLLCYPMATSIEQMDLMAEFAQQARDFDPMLSQCWASVVDSGHITLRNVQILDAFRVNFDFWHVLTALTSRPVRQLLFVKYSVVDVSF